MSGKDKLISVEHLKWNVGGIKCGTLTVDYLNWILDHEEPAVDAEPVRHGKWIDGHCSICGCDVPAYINDWKWQKDMNARFCPMCGARMDEERKEE